MLLPITTEIEEEYRQRRPLAVYGLLALMAAVHVYLYLYASEPARHDIFYRFGVVPYTLRWWSPLTCTLLHGGWMHLLGNGYFLWLYGSCLERLLGSRRFLELYIAGAVISVWVHLATISPLYVDIPIIGASGAISAVLGAFFARLPRARLRCLFFSIISFRPIIVNLRAWVILGMWFIGQLLYTLGVLGEVGGIAFWAHVAGFVAGAGMGACADLLRRRALRQSERQLRQPLGHAWAAHIQGQPQAARACLQPIADAHVPESHGSHQLLTALLDCAEGKSPAVAPALTRSFEQARDYRDDAMMLTAYLQLTRLVPALLVPGEIHRDVGFAAVRCGRRGLALAAFHRAIELGVDERLAQTLRAVESILANDLGMPGPAAAVARIRQQVAPD